MCGTGAHMQAPPAGPSRHGWQGFRAGSFSRIRLSLNNENTLTENMVGVDQVLESLGKVIDPDLKKDIVSMGMIKDLELDDGNLKFTLELTTPACPFNVEIEDDVRKVIGELDGIKNLNLNVTAKVMEGRSLDEDAGMTTVKNIIGVASGKGGVGKSTVALNLALALGQTGAKVGLLDADIYGPSIPLMLGMKEAFMEVEANKLQPAEASGIKVVSFGFFAEQAHKAAIYRGPIISGILKQFLVDTNWSDLDYLIVDLPPGTGDIPLTLAQTIPITGILVVTTPQNVASNVAVKAVGMFEKLNVPIIGVVENMSGFVCNKCGEKHNVFGEGGAKRISEQFKIPLIGEIPLTAGIMAGSEEGRPIILTDPDSPSSNAFRSSAKNIAAQCSIIAAKLQEEMAAEAAASPDAGGAEGQSPPQQDAGKPLGVASAAEKDGGL
ncbi:ATPases involved in chromosome partitioning [Cenarchaeum symbiosum A]|uniref:Iron-sulfur cluster carrier protein n=1 Tax=Cenarchaeum symbiosum (strain A) TaxID=414004 RepID=A0RW80_CENSY|nr:ATPases involved in chromosome partitioning [Cenarchaeum symbiosum A]